MLETTRGKIDHDSISQLHYLEATIYENLRMNGPANDNFRLCSKDVEVNGIKFKKGTRVLIPSWPSHHNEEFFPEPEEFKPERFLKENASNIIPFTFRAFGGGNRACIGQRFAMNEMKICLAKLLNRFRIEMTPETKLEFHKGSLFMLVFDDVKVKFVARQ
jgi:cytochrome P450